MSGEVTPANSLRAPSVGSLLGRRVLVTAGPTWVPIDAVRHIGNVSSGRTGLTIARSLSDAGAAVTLILGPGQAQLTDHDRSRLEVLPVVTYHQMRSTIHQRVGSHTYDAMVHTAAVSDYEPVEAAPGKLSSDSEELVIRLRPTPKIVDEVKPLDPEILLVKFKLEVGRTESELLAIAAESRRRSQAELLVANDLTGIDARRHRAYVVDAGGVVARVETADELAACLVGLLADRFSGRPPRSGAVTAPGDLET